MAEVSEMRLTLAKKEKILQGMTCPCVCEYVSRTLAVLEAGGRIEIFSKWDAYEHICDYYPELYDAAGEELQDVIIDDRVLELVALRYLEQGYRLHTENLHCDEEKAPCVCTVVSPSGDRAIPITRSVYYNRLDSCQTLVERFDALTGEFGNFLSNWMAETGMSSEKMLR